MINVRQMEVLRAFMLTGTVSDAARLLKVTQPAVSLSLNHLQDQLGVPLYERVRGRLLPTANARELYEEIGKAWDGIERVRTLANILRLERPEVLSLTAHPGFGSGVLPTVVAALLERKRKVKVQVNLSPPNLLMEALLAGDADIGLAFGSVEHPNLLLEEVGLALFVCVMPEGHELTKHEAVSIEELVNHRLVSHSMQMAEGRHVEEAFSAAGISQDANVEVRSGQTACFFVQAGAGIALIDDVTVSLENFSGLVSRPLENSPEIKVYLVRNSSRALSEPAKLFSRLVRQHFRERVGLSSTSPTKPVPLDRQR